MKTLNDHISAAEAGSPASQLHVGHHYYYGLGLDQDFSEAIRWYRRACDQGHPPAIERMRLLASCGTSYAGDDLGLAS